MKDGDQDFSSMAGAAKMLGALALALLAILLAVLVWWQFPKERAESSPHVASVRAR
jgi:hypothetical protein